MTFGEAFEFLAKGDKIYRPSWKTLKFIHRVKNQYGDDRVGYEMHFGPHGYNYQFCMIDLFATDWELYTEDPKTQTLEQLMK